MISLKHGDRIRNANWSRVSTAAVFTVRGFAESEGISVDDAARMARDAGEPMAASIYTGGAIMCDGPAKDAYYARLESEYQSAVTLSDGECVLIDGAVYRVRFNRGCTGSEPTLSDPIAFDYVEEYAESVNHGFTRENPVALMVDSHHGQYAWQAFAETANREFFDGITAEQWAILEAGPHHEHHFDVACECEQAEHSSGVALYQDGDIWAYCPDYVGHADDIEEHEVDAGNRIASDSELCRDIASLYANLMDGPSFGEWSQDLLESVRDRVEAHCDAVNDAAPLFWHGDNGIEEHRLDTIARAIVESPSLSAISRYW